MMGKIIKRVREQERIVKFKKENSDTTRSFYVRETSIVDTIATVVVVVCGIASVVMITANWWQSHF